LDKEEDEFVECFIAEDLTGDLVRGVPRYATKISYVFLIPEVPTSDDIFMDNCKELAQCCLLKTTSESISKIWGMLK
jgi:hypothetical protein